MIRLNVFLATSYTLVVKDPTQFPSLSGFGTGCEIIGRVVVKLNVVCNDTKAYIEELLVSWLYTSREGVREPGQCICSHALAFFLVLQLQISC